MRQSYGAGWLVGALMAMCGAAGCDGGPATVTSPSIAATPPAPTPPDPPPPGADPPPGAVFPPVNRIIWGRVIDYDSDAPVARATVSLWQYHLDTETQVLAVTTTGDGRFNLTAATRGAFWVKVDRSGYEPVSYCCEFDYSGDVTLKAYRTLAIRPGESATMQVFADFGGTRCGDESFFWCRRVAVNAPDGQPVTFEVEAGDRVVVTDNQEFANWAPIGAGLTTSARAVWIVRFASYRDPPLRVTLHAR